MQQSDMVHCRFEDEILRRTGNEENNHRATLLAAKSISVLNLMHRPEYQKQSTHNSLAVSKLSRSFKKIIPLCS